MCTPPEAESRLFLLALAPGSQLRPLHHALGPCHLRGGGVAKNTTLSPEQASGLQPWEGRACHSSQIPASPAQGAAYGTKLTDTVLRFEQPAKGMPSFLYQNSETRSPENRRLFLYSVNMAFVVSTNVEQSRWCLSGGQSAGSRSLGGREQGHSLAAPGVLMSRGETLLPDHLPFASECGSAWHQPFPDGTQTPCGPCQPHAMRAS